MKKIAIAFDKRAAVAVLPAQQETATEVLSALALPAHKAVLVVVGAAAGLAPSLVPQLTQLFGRGIARAAQEAEAIVVDGGTHAGVMALMGEGVASRGYGTALLGVAPAALVALPGSPAGGTALEPHHSHFVLVEGDKWGDETATLFQLVQALMSTPTLAPPQGRKAAPRLDSVPALVVLTGGGAVATTEIVQAVRQRLPVLVLAGSGGLADVLATAWPDRNTPPDDPMLAEILADGVLRFYPVSGSAPGLERLISRELGADQVLLQAWETFAEYDANANRQQRRFDRLQQAIILLGLAGTALAIGQQLYAPKEPGTTTLLAAAALWQQAQWGWWLVRHGLILVPILLTVLVAATNRFKQGSKWLLLRAGAETIKREIFRYRARAMSYVANGEPQLALRIEEITRRTMRTEVNSSSLVPYDKRNGFPPGLEATASGDDGLGFLSPARYVAIRLENQLKYFRGKAVGLEKQLTALSWATFMVGGVGTYLAAVGQQVWIALTTAVVAAMGTYLGYRQTESALTKYNQAATDLANVRAWWHALSPEEQLLQANTDLLVEHTEQVLQADLDGWVQQMQNALAELHKNQALPTEREEQKAPQEAPPAILSGATPAPAPTPGTATASTSASPDPTAEDMDETVPTEAETEETPTSVAAASADS